MPRLRATSTSVELSRLKRTRPSTSSGARPASSSAARIASRAICFSGRPMFLENAVCPMPTMAVRFFTALVLSRAASRRQRSARASPSPPQPRHDGDPPVAHFDRLEPGDEARILRPLVEILRQVLLAELIDDPRGERLSFDRGRIQRDDQHAVLERDLEGGGAVEPAVRIAHPLQRNRELAVDLAFAD